METQAYCVKCRKTQTVTNATVKEAASGRRMAQGTCRSVDESDALSAEQEEGCLRTREHLSRSGGMYVKRHTEG